VLILYSASANQPLTINLDAPITLNNLEVEGNVALYVNASSLAVKSVSLTGGDYTTEIQLNNSEVTLRSLQLNNADFLAKYSLISILLFFSFSFSFFFFFFFLI
jgi:hypothetical protein